jgi:multiple sugar transport system permease protein
MVKRDSKLKIFLTYAALILWSLVVIVPLYWTVVTSLKNPIDVNRGPKYIPGVDFTATLDNWTYFFVAEWRSFSSQYFNSIFVSIVSSIVCLAIGSLAAYALTRFQYRIGKMRNSDIAFWFVSQRILPPVVVVIPLYVLYQFLHIHDTKFGLILAYATFNLPFVVWLMRDYFLGIPAELEESAYIDGCSKFEAFWRITLPLSAPGLVATFLFIIVFAWNEYLIANFLTQTLNSATMPLLVTAQNAQRGPQWWSISVLTIVVIAPVSVLAFFLERYISRGLLVGAVKG